MRIVIQLIYLAILVLYLVAMWKIYVKAGKPGWAAIIPIYNLIVLMEIVGKPMWWFILLLIPIVNIIVGIIVCIELAKKFGQPTWHVILMILVGFIYFPWLAFSDAKYTA